MTTNSSSLYVANKFVKIDGQKAPDDLTNDILQVLVEESLHLPSMFTIAVYNPYYPGDTETKTWKYDQYLQIGKIIEVGFSASTTTATEFNEESVSYIIKGEVTAIETHFTKESIAPIVIRGYDISHRLHRGRYNRSFQNITDSDLVSQIASELGIETNTIDSSGDPHDYIFQENETNMEFLRKRATRIGFELFVQDGKLNFRKPKAGETLELKWLTDFESFRVRVTSAEQVSSVEVRGWDYGNKEAIVSSRDTDTVITSTLNGKGKNSNSSFTGQAVSPKMIVVDQPIFSRNEADAMAQALCDELGGEFIYADSNAPGNPKIRVGKLLSLKEMGRYDGTYYITECRHLFYEGVYSTQFSVRGLRGGSILDVLSPANRIKPGQGFLVGIVTDNQDPQDWGRVRVKFPTLTPDDNSNAHSSWWARVVGVGAGNSRGFYSLPEINDEVLVGFEHGDIHRPYVVGLVWNGQDAPPTTLNDTIDDRGQVRLRTFKTRAGHQLQFVESDQATSKTGIYITTNGGNKISVNDSDKTINIETISHQISLNDTANQVTISSNGTITVVGKDQITISGSVINLTTTTGVAISPSLTVSGPITCTTLAATTVTAGGVDLGQAIVDLQSQQQEITSVNTQQSQDITSLQSQQQEITSVNTQQSQDISTLQSQANSTNTTQN